MNNLTNLEAVITRCRLDLMGAASRVNDYASSGDLGRNRTNYGVVSHSADLLRRIGLEVLVAAWGDGEFLKIERIAIDGEEMAF